MLLAKVLFSLGTGWEMWTRSMRRMAADPGHTWTRPQGDARTQILGDRWTQNRTRRESLTRLSAASEAGGSPVAHKKQGVGGEEICECDHRGGRGLGKKAFGARKHRKPPPST